MNGTVLDAQGGLNWPEKLAGLCLDGHRHLSRSPDFWRAMILARLDRAEGARKAHGDGIQKLRAGFPPDYDMNGAVMTFYASHAFRQEAGEVLCSQGIAVPDTETTR